LLGVGFENMMRSELGHEMRGPARLVLARAFIRLSHTHSPLRMCVCVVGWGLLCVWLCCVCMCVWARLDVFQALPMDTYVRFSI